MKKYYRFNMHVDKPLIEDFDKIAKAEGRSKADLIKEYMRKRVEECKTAA